MRAARLRMPQQKAARLREADVGSSWRVRAHQHLLTLPRSHARVASRAPPDLLFTHCKEINSVARRPICSASSVRVQMWRRRCSPSAPRRAKWITHDDDESVAARSVNMNNGLRRAEFDILIIIIIRDALGCSRDETCARINSRA